MEQSLADFQFFWRNFFVFDEAKSEKAKKVSRSKKKMVSQSLKSNRTLRRPHSKKNEPKRRYEESSVVNSKITEIQQSEEVSPLNGQSDQRYETSQLDDLDIQQTEECVEEHTEEDPLFRGVCWRPNKGVLLKVEAKRKFFLTLSYPDPTFFRGIVWKPNKGVLLRKVEVKRKFFLTLRLY